MIALPGCRLSRLHNKVKNRIWSWRRDEARFSFLRHFFPSVFPPSKLYFLDLCIDDRQKDGASLPEGCAEFWHNLQHPLPPPSEKELCCPDICVLWDLASLLTLSFSPSLRFSNYEYLCLGWSRFKVGLSLGRLLLIFSYVIGSIFGAVVIVYCTTGVGDNKGMLKTCHSALSMRHFLELAATSQFDQHHCYPASLKNKLPLNSSILNIQCFWSSSYFISATNSLCSF